MPRFIVKVKDKATGQESDLEVGGQPTQDAAEKHVAEMPGSFGGQHPGFEVVPAKDE